MSSKWIAEGATVLVEGGGVGNVICLCGNYDEDGYTDNEAAHRMAEMIALEHNALQEIKEILTGSTYQGNDAYAILDDIKRLVLGARP